MKFAKLTAPNGASVYVHPSVIVLPSLQLQFGSEIRTQMGTQEVRESPADVVAALGEIDQ